MKCTIILSAFALLVVVASAQVANTNYGKVSGYTTATHKVWKGIPFAAPPVDSLRWQPPQNPTPWSDIKNTSAFSSFCVQSSGGVAVGSEDCLYLNIWTPKNANLNTANLPVLVFIYGGSFTGGRADNFDGEYLSGEDVILVTFNYRVGALGFLYHPALADASPLRTSGFYGMQDQRLAFKWIRENIQHFGGNPNKVTVSGESAGAISLCLHLAAPRSAGHFDQAISQSGFCHTYTQSEGTAVGNYVAYKLGCSGSNVEACLRSATPQQLITAQSAVPVFYPTSHPYEIDDIPISKIDKGEYTPVPLLGGTNLNESSYIFCLYYANFNYQQFVAYVNASYVSSSYSKNLNTILEVYNADNYPAPVSAMIAIAADRSFKCFTKSLYQANVKKGVPSYMYSFDVHPSFSPAPCFGAAHAYELNFIYPSLNSQPLTAAEQVLARNMRDSWVSFVKTGTPKLTSGQAWPRYTNNEEYLILDLEIGYNSDFLDAFCPVWNNSAARAVASPVPAVPATYPISTPAPTPACSGLNFAQTKTSSWTSNGQDFSQYSVTLQVGSQSLYSVQIEADTTASFNPWNINKVAGSSNLYTIPDYQYTNGALPAGSSSVTFGYTISSANPATLNLKNNACAPKECLNVRVTPTLTSSWVSGATTFRQYQLNVVNGSPSTLANVKVEINFSGNSYVQSSWNIAPSTSVAGASSQIFTCNVNNLQSGGSNTGCGYTLAIPSSSATSSNQAVFVSQAVCL